MNRYLPGVVAALLLLPACGSGAGVAADPKATIVTCAGYMTALEAAMETQDAPAFTKAMNETSSTDMKGREQMLELRAADFNEMSRTMRATMDPAEATQLEQKGTDLARQHHSAGDGVAAGHYVAGCADTYWQSVKKP